MPRIAEFGRIPHYNVDKALLVSGGTKPRCGGADRARCASSSATASMSARLPGRREGLAAAQSSLRRSRAALRFPKRVEGRQARTDRPLCARDAGLGRLSSSLALHQRCDPTQGRRLIETGNDHVNFFTTVQARSTMLFSSRRASAPQWPLSRYWD